MSEGNTRLNYLEVACISLIIQVLADNKVERGGDLLTKTGGLVNERKIRSSLF